MNIAQVRRVAPAALVAATLLAGVATASPASAAAPPYEPDPASVGTITFYDASGAVVTGGSSSTSPFAAYAVGEAFPGQVTPQAQLLYANPDPNSTPAHWYKENVGLYTQLPMSAGPANIQALSQTHPVVAVGKGDQTPDGFEEDSILSTTAGYQNVVQVRMRTATAAGLTTTGYDVADIQIDPTAHTWTQIYPVPANQTAPGAPTGVTATAGNASATVGWTAPADNGGAPITGYDLEQSSDGGVTFAPVAHAGTTTSQVVTGLTNGTHYVFEVAAINSVGTSAYAVAPAVTPVAPPPPAPDATSLTVAGGRTIAYGAAVAISGVLRDARTGRPVAGQNVTLQQRPATAKAYTNVRVVRSTSSGAVAFAVRPTVTTAYRWVYSGASTLTASASAATGVTVAWVVTGALNHAGVKHGTTVDLYGAPLRLKVGTRVYLQQLSGRRWVTTRSYGVLKRQKLPNGRTGYGYVIVVKLAKRGTYTFRAYVPTASGLVGGVSAARTVKAT